MGPHTADLTKIAAEIQGGKDALTEHRRAECLKCEHHKLRPDGGIQCDICGCGDPAQTREFCPDTPARWGRDAKQAAYRQRLNRRDTEGAEAKKAKEADESVLRDLPPTPRLWRAGRASAVKTVLSRFTGLELNLSDRCNLRCDFCYTRDCLNRPPDLDRTKRFIQWFAGHANPEVKRWTLTFYGGEPLVEWEDLTEAIRWTRMVFPDKPWGFSIVTNLTLLTARKLDWLEAERVGVHPSIDGCPEAIDAHRKRADGTGASGPIIENVRRLVERQPGRSARMTVTPQTVRWLEKSIRFLADDIGFKTINPILAGGADWDDAALRMLFDQLPRVTDWWIDQMRRQRHVSIYYLRNMLKGVWMPIRGGRCHAGISRIAIDTLGNIWPCHRFCNSASRPEYRLGTVADGLTNTELLNTLVDADMKAIQKDRCAGCVAVNSCHAICLHESMLQGKGMFDPLPHYCRVWPVYWREAMRAHAILTAEGNRFYRRLYDARAAEGRRQRGRRSPA